jgi:hypothetical protein
LSAWCLSPVGRGCCRLRLRKTSLKTNAACCTPSLASQPAYAVVMSLHKRTTRVLSGTLARCVFLNSNRP